VAFQLTLTPYPLSHCDGRGGSVLRGCAAVCDRCPPMTPGLRPAPLAREWNSLPSLVVAKQRPKGFAATSQRCAAIEAASCEARCERGRADRRRRGDFSGVHPCTRGFYYGRVRRPAPTLSAQVHRANRDARGVAMGLLGRFPRWQDFPDKYIIIAKYP
jgi:hypothetical protein